MITRLYFGEAALGISAAHRNPLLRRPPMTSMLRSAALALALTACASAPVATTPAPSTGTTASTTHASGGSAPTAGVSTPVPAATAAEAPANWQLLDLSEDHIAGISSERAMHELLANRTPRRTVLVAVIDGGVDTSHADLRANLWTNPKETPDGRDDDGNGHVDDIHGWDFIGGPGGDVRYDTFELTRLHAECIGAPAAAGLPPMTAAEKQRCPEYAQAYDSTRADYEQQLANIAPIAEAVTRMLPVLKRAAATESLTVENVRAIQPNDPQVNQARQIYLRLAALGATPQQVFDARDDLESRLKYGLDTTYNPRSIVGDQYANLSQHAYGNADVMGADAKHGTHVSGIIGAVRGNGLGVEGIAPAVKIMMIRTVPDGDERDKDVANAIRYAADAGASVINMSFGKGYSPQKAVVDEAVKYADAKGVLMVHAAGNDGADLSKASNFPTPKYLDGGRAQNWIEVGASSWKGGNDLAATFTNYGQNDVDVFAPGVDILSTVPGGQYERDSGTSMAAPVVTGLAALLMSYYPQLTAADVKHVILASASRHADQMVLRPGSQTERVRFGQLSATGGIVNAYEAVRMADSLTATHP